MPLNITTSQLPRLVELCRKSKNNLLIVGDPGVGKSQTILSLANSKCKVTMMTGSSTYEETVNGIPRDNKSENVQDYTRPEWFVEILDWAKKHEKDKDAYQILFIDEFNTADAQVLKTFLSILSEGKIPTQDEAFPENVVMVAAMNPCSQNEGEELIRPMASRFVTVEIKNNRETFTELVQKGPGALNEEVAKSDWLETLDEPKDISADLKQGYIEQISDEDWAHFEPGTYHEINPRSMTNFFRALSYVKNKKRDSGILSQAMLGRSLVLPDTTEVREARAKEREQKVKNGSVLPNRAELEKMSTEDLKKLKTTMASLGGRGTSVTANILEILVSRGETI